MEYDNKIIGIPLSGGINSAAVLCWFIEQGFKPKELHLFYAHFAEHSPDTFQFVADQVRYARKHIANVKVKITRNSVLRFFENEKMIPHPTVSPCSKKLKIEPMERYFFENGVQVDLVGYVKGELKRINRSKKNTIPNLFYEKDFPIKNFTDDWCFEIVDRHIGWHPAIYDLRDENGKRVFKHNNCLPCKNMHLSQMKKVAFYFPEYMTDAIKLSTDLQTYWGRDAQDYYTTFGREDYEPTQCAACAFD